MVTSFEKFRAKYPEGGLTADLISIHDGQYVVRAAVMNKGVTLATGLATSVDVQIAEDRARDRALAVLGIIESTESLATTTSTEENTISTPTATLSPSAQPAEPDTSEAVGILETSEVPSAPDDDDMGPPIDVIAEEPLAAPEAKPSAATLALQNFDTSATPVDLSDVIAQTDVELTRLGWTNAQGREYLEKTYGKRSRQQLTDEELLSFLLYLEEQ